MRLHRVLLAFAMFLPGCPDRTISAVTPQQEGEVKKDIPVSADIDILFVIDNSKSTADKQTVFAANFPKFVQALDAFPTGRPNIHVGVVSTTVDIHAQGFGGCPSPAPNDDGILQNTPRVAGCTPPMGRFLSDIKSSNNTRTTNYSGSLDSALSCIAQLGPNGCGFEAPLEAMKRALDGSRQENTGFLRDGAFLAVVILTDEDDCSIKDPAIFQLPDAQAGGRSDFRCQPLFAYRCDTPISPTTGGSYASCTVRTDSYLQDPAVYAQFLSTVKPPGKSIVALIAGDPSTSIMTGPVPMQPLALELEPSCMATINGNFAIGRPAIRLSSFLALFGDHGLFRTVCQSDYSQALTDVGKLLFTAISPCLEGAINLADSDPANPGLQPDCTVSDVQNPDSGHETETLLPRCQMTDPTTPAAGARPCWWVAPNPASCATQTNLELHVERATPPSTGTSVRVACATGS